MSEILVAFDRSTQTIGALREAAYRIIRHASCRIELIGDRYLCHLAFKGEGSAPRIEELHHRFLDLVTDENLREKVASETSGVRDVILALAFGALAVQREDSSPG
jgi:His-Xaa-Ser system protein HxsD